VPGAESCCILVGGKEEEEEEEDKEEDEGITCGWLPSILWRWARDQSMMSALWIDERGIDGERWGEMERDESCEMGWKERDADEKERKEKGRCIQLNERTNE